MNDSQLCCQVKSILKEGDPEKIARVEQQVLEIWDRVYQSWVSGMFAQSGPQVDGSAVQESWDNFVLEAGTSGGIRHIHNLCMTFKMTWPFHVRYLVIPSFAYMH